MSGAEATFGAVFKAVRRIIEARGLRQPDEPVITYVEGPIEVSRTALNEYEVRHDNALVFRARHTGALSNEHVFTPGEWAGEVMRIAWGAGPEERRKK